MRKKTVVLTRPISQGDDWENYLKRRGVSVVRFPTIKTVSVAVTARAKRTLTGVRHFDWIVFTSAAGPMFLGSLARRCRITLPASKEMPPIAAIGEKTAHAVRKSGYRAAWKPRRSDGAALARGLKEVRGSSILLLRADIASQELPRMLRARGARVTDLAVYSTKAVSRPAEAWFKRLLIADRVDCLIFASPSAVRGFQVRMRSKTLVAAARGIPVVAFGPSVRTALLRAGFKKVRMARAATVKALAQAIAAS